MAYTHLDPGLELEVSERMYFSNSTGGESLSPLITLPPDELKQMEEASIEREKAIYERLRGVAAEWRCQAKQTMDLRKAQQYLKIPATPHTSNQWVKGNYDWYELSNMVYKMTYRIWEETNYRSNVTPRPLYWELSWHLSYNTPQNPDYSGGGWKIAGQERKRFDDRAAMEKYLQGRINAYAHLFTELSPPIPQDEQKRFYVNGVLLPGYTVEDPNALKPDETKVDELLAFLDDDEIGDEVTSPPLDPQPVEKSPQAIWEKHRKQRTGASQRKSSPVR